QNPLTSSAFGKAWSSPSLNLQGWQPSWSWNLSQTGQRAPPSKSGSSKHFVLTFQRTCLVRNVSGNLRNQNHSSLIFSAPAVPARIAADPDLALLKPAPNVRAAA